MGCRAQRERGRDSGGDVRRAQTMSAVLGGEHQVLDVCKVGAWGGGLPFTHVHGWCCARPGFCAEKAGVIALPNVFHIMALGHEGRATGRATSGLHHSSQRWPRGPGGAVALPFPHGFQQQSPCTYLCS